MKSTSFQAMDAFIKNSPGLLRPRIAQKIPGLPSLPGLKVMARQRSAQGLTVIDQSAGDIADLGQPMAPEFLDWIAIARQQLIDAGHSNFAETNLPFGYPGHYQPQYPEVGQTLVSSWGIEKTPCLSLQTISGRAAIDFALRGLLARADRRNKKQRRAVVLDPLAWSGYTPLTSALGLEIVHAPCVEGHGLAATAQGLEQALRFSREQNIEVIGTIAILPSNPSGVGMSGDQLQAFVETAAAADVPVLIDAFYSPLDPMGHANAVPMAQIEQQVADEALSYLGLIVGETKVTSSQNKTGTLIWLAPAHDGDDDNSNAAIIVNAAKKRMMDTNCYPRPQEALVSYALHTFPGGVHQAMGPRYVMLDKTRTAMLQSCEKHGLPFSIGGSFYGTVALVDDRGRSLIRDDRGEALATPKQVIETLIERFGLVGAPGAMFSSAPEAAVLVRLTAAITLEDVARVDSIFEQMLNA